MVWAGLTSQQPSCLGLTSAGVTGICENSQPPAGDGVRLHFVVVVIVTVWEL